MKKISKFIKLLVILLIILCIILAVILIIKNNLLNNDTISDETGREWKRKEVYADPTITSGNAIALKWDEKSITQKFSTVEYMGNIYDTSRNVKTSSDKIGEELGKATLTGKDTYTDTNYTANATLYELKDFPAECIIVVQFEGDTDYYIYANSYYKPETLGDFMDDLHLKDIVDFGTVYYNYTYIDSSGERQFAEVEFYNIDDELILQMLFDDRSLENIYNDNGRYTGDYFTQSVSISVNIPMLGVENISVSLTDKGYLITNILETGKGFYIGEDKVQGFIDYISNNYEGYRIVYVDENGNEITDEEEENIEGGTIMVTQNTANGSVSQEVDMNEISSGVNLTSIYNSR